MQPLAFPSFHHLTHKADNRPFSGSNAGKRYFPGRFIAEKQHKYK